jgi:hypothetical protein
MPADDGGAAAIGAGVGKPPGKEPAKDGSGSGRECYGDLWVAQAHHLQLGEAQVTAVGLTPSGTVVAEDVRDLQSRPSHRRRPVMPAVASPSLASAAAADRAG